jgi:hypothetical protein
MFSEKIQLFSGFYIHASNERDFNFLEILANIAFFFCSFTFESIIKSDALKCFGNLNEHYCKQDLNICVYVCLSLFRESNLQLEKKYIKKDENANKEAVQWSKALKLFLSNVLLISTQIVLRRKRISNLSCSLNDKPKKNDEAHSFPSI